METEVMNTVAVQQAVEALGRAFEEFKSANDAREARADVVLEHKVAAIGDDLGQLQARLDRMHMAINRPTISGAVQADVTGPEIREHKTAFYDRFVRRGIETGLGDLEGKALSISTDADGGYSVPRELDQTIERLTKDLSPIRRIANVVQVGSAQYRKLVTVSGLASGWVGEVAGRPVTNSMQFAEVVPPLGEIYANPAATQAMLDDSFFDVETWLAEQIAVEFAVQEGTAFVSGDGANKPKGFLSYTTALTADGARAFGSLQHIVTGVSAGFPASNPSDKLIDLVHALRPVYRDAAAFVMNTNVLAAVRKFKDADGNYLWRPGLGVGQSATLLGYPVIEAQDMPDVAANSLSVAFGNFARGYTITDRSSVRVLRDPYSNKPYVHFYSTKRVGGGVVNSDCIKLLKFSV
ncbi:phage major capsid protein [Govanella unica]|uniref:Phage major capsid protein n=1 Tax=Govanella unica TaxID=2975056 RepID=A0A9X3Z840_9PROT|nr:phage major capsid protein [Govania unica]MDA5194940.1 phage major capsid protein [Govania unica]